MCHVFPCSCVEVIICEQMNKYKVRIKDINTLEFAETKAKCRLSVIQRSMVRDLWHECVGDRSVSVTTWNDMCKDSK